MFEPIEPAPSYGAALPSALIHGLLIAAAIGASRVVPQVPISEPGVIFEVALPVETSRHVAVAPAPNTIIAAPPITSDPPVGLPPVTEMPTIPGVRVVDPKALLDPAVLHVGWQERADTLGTATVMSESEVDDPPSLLAAGPLRYPPVLREAGIAGSVTLTFIVDPDGRVESDGVEVWSATHRGFIASAMEAIEASRFRPARQHGQLVRVRVRQTVIFHP